MAKKYTFELLVLAMSMLSLSASACSGPQDQPTQTHVSFFPVNSATLPMKEIADLAAWAVEMKLRYPVQHWTSIGATAAPTEQAAVALAAHRADVLKDLAVQFGLTRGGMEMHDYVQSLVDAKINGKFAASGQIDFSPGCPVNCCD
ncbi:hypothetical protein [Paraburkholderia sp.]|uniref:hypothetical protein n=1 Tax=Paraburkholderia sp. TaxID=1926495 RepID=UPI003D6F2DD6